MTPPQATRLVEASKAVLRDYRYAIEAARLDHMVGDEEVAESEELAKELEDALRPLEDEAPAVLSEGP